jgi:hypothetical protein
VWPEGRSACSGLAGPAGAAVLAAGTVCLLGIDDPGDETDGARSTSARRSGCDLHSRLGRSDVRRKASAIRSLDNSVMHDKSYEKMGSLDFSEPPYAKVVGLSLRDRA